jgi:hypothetical protein
MPCGRSKIARRLVRQHPGSVDCATDAKTAETIARAIGVLK